MEVSVTTFEGEAAGKAELDDAIFGVQDIRSDILHRVVRWQLAKRQAGTHKTQSRGEVSVTTKKFVRQKGSGGARHGSRNAPIFVGGAVAHGPRVRSHAHGLPKKIRRMALAHALSAKTKEGSLTILDDAHLETAKTKSLQDKLAKLGLENALIISGVSVEDNLAKAARNIKNIDVLPVMGLNVYDILRRKQLVLTKDAVAGIKRRYEGQTDAPASAIVDDIRLIDGIGLKIAKALKAEKLTTLTAYVGLSEADRAALLEKLGAGEKAERQDWLGQASEMLAGKPPRAKSDQKLAARLSKGSKQTTANGV